LEYLNSEIQIASSKKHGVENEGNLYIKKPKANPNKDSIIFFIFYRLPIRLLDSNSFLKTAQKSGFNFSFLL